MTWVDLALACIISWGAVTGYLSGGRRMGGEVLALLVVLAAGSFFKEDMSSFLAKYLSAEETIRALVGRHLVLPVEAGRLHGSSGFPAQGFPGLIQELLARQVIVLPAADQAGAVMDILVRLALNSAAFLLFLLLLGGTVYLSGGAPLLQRLPQRSVLDRWVGGFLGLLRQYILVAVLCGTVLPLLCLLGPSWTWPGLEKALLVRASLILVDRLGIWW